MYGWQVIAEDKAMWIICLDTFNNGLKLIYLFTKKQVVKMKQIITAKNNKYFNLKYLGGRLTNILHV
jgi:hypothetical protein